MRLFIEMISQPKMKREKIWTQISLQSKQNKLQKISIRFLTLKQKKPKAKKLEKEKKNKKNWTFSFKGHNNFSRSQNYY